jgi:hypothetical protein
VTVALLGLDGFVVLAAADAGGEVELLVETTAELVGCRGCGAVARAKDRRSTWVRDLPVGGAAGGDLLAQAGLVLPTSGVPGEDVDRNGSGDRAAGMLERAGSGLGL